MSTWTAELQLKVNGNGNASHLNTPVFQTWITSINNPTSTIALPFLNAMSKDQHDPAPAYDAPPAFDDEHHSHPPPAIAVKYAASSSYKSSSFPSVSSMPIPNVSPLTAHVHPLNLILNDPTNCVVSSSPSSQICTII